MVSFSGVVAADKGDATSSTELPSSIKNPILTTLALMLKLNTAVIFLQYSSEGLTISFSFLLLVALLSPYLGHGVNVSYGNGSKPPLL